MSISFILRRMAIIILCMIMLPISGAAAQTGHPMVVPAMPQYIATEDTYFNILLAGIDLGVGDYLGSGAKDKVFLEDCHADALMVVSVNMDSGGVNLISLPRDLIAYVPGACGLYKLNGAVNCGDTIEQGLERTCGAVSRILGGIEVSHYCAIDMGTMIALGDALGGVEFEMDMAYTGSSGVRYLPGMQTLDGMGIVDYLRARKNATREGTDLGRTNRQRELMLAILEKVKKNPLLVAKIIDVMQDPAYNLMTNLNLPEILSLASRAAAVDVQNVGSYVLSGNYRPVMGWNFTLIDQENRQMVLKEAFGIEASPLPYSDRRFIEWLEKTGLNSVRYIGATRRILSMIEDREMTPEQAENAAELSSLLDEQIDLFSLAADTLEYRERVEMERSRTALRQAGEEAIEIFHLKAEIYTYDQQADWYKDIRINEYQYNWQ